MRAYRFRLKGNNSAILNKMAESVNFVWNYCNQVSVEYLDKRNKWLSDFDLAALTKGCSADLGISAQTIKAIAREYAVRRYQRKKIKLSWRSSKRSLGWIPMTRQDCKIKGDRVKYRKHLFRFWNSRDIQGFYRSSSFCQDSRGRWYVNVICDRPITAKIKSGDEVGIDLGLTTIATLSNGVKLSRENLTAKYADRLAMAQRARKRKMFKAIHAKIRNSRKDWNHKETTKLINRYDTIIVGNVSPSRLIKTRMAKSVSDASWYDFKTMLTYKAIALGVVFKEVNESYSTVTCSGCFERSGPSGLSTLGVREWICKSCGAVHDRDVNAAKNILRFGHESPIKGSSLIIN